MSLGASSLGSTSFGSLPNVYQVQAVVFDPLAIRLDDDPSAIWTDTEDVEWLNNIYVEWDGVSTIFDESAAISVNDSLAGVITVDDSLQATIIVDDHLNMA